MKALFVKSNMNPKHLGTLNSSNTLNGVFEVVFLCYRSTYVILSPLQLADPCCPGSAPHDAGVSGLHADAVRHVLQHLDLPGGHRGLWPRLFDLLPSAAYHLMLRTVQRSSIFCLLSRFCLGLCLSKGLLMTTTTCSVIYSK